MCDSCRGPGKGIVFPIEEYAGSIPAKMRRCYICGKKSVTHYERATCPEEGKFFCADHVPVVTKYLMAFVIAGKKVQVYQVELNWYNLPWPEPGVRSKPKAEAAV